MVTRKGEVGRKEAKRDSTTTLVDRELNTKANMIALHRGIQLRDYIDSILRPTIERDFREMGEQIAGK